MRWVIRKDTRVGWLLLAGLLMMLPALAIAGPAEEANAAIDRWSAAYSANDVEALVKSYWPDAILLGTKSPVIALGGGRDQEILH